MVDNKYNAKIAEKWSGLTIDADENPRTYKSKKRTTKRAVILGSRDKSLVSILNSFLSESDFEVLAAESGLAVAELLVTQAPALIILEKELPEIDGLTLCRDYKANRTLDPVPILLIVPQNVASEKNGIPNCSADTIIEDPFHKLAFLCEVNELLNENVNIENFSVPDLKEAILLVINELPDKECKKPDLIFHLAIYFNIHSFSLSAHFGDKINSVVDELKCEQMIEEFVTDGALFLKMADDVCAG